MPPRRQHQVKRYPPHQAVQYDDVAAADIENQQPYPHNHEPAPSFSSSSAFGNQQSSSASKIHNNKAKKPRVANDDVIISLLHSVLTGNQLILNKQQQHAEDVKIAAAAKGRKGKVNRKLEDLKIKMTTDFPYVLAVTTTSIFRACHMYFY